MLASSRRRVELVLVAAILLAGVAGCGGQSINDPVLAKLVGVVDVQDCSSEPLQLLSARSTPGTPAGFARLASERAWIGCTPDGTSLVYLAFASPRRLRAALLTYPQVLRHHACAFGRDMFLNDNFYDGDTAYYVADFCRRMRGRAPDPRD